MVEDPGIDSLIYVRLGLPVNGKTGRGEDPAIITATGLRTIFVDRTFVVDQHRAVAIVAIAHEHVASWEAERETAACGEFVGWFAFPQAWCV